MFMGPVLMLPGQIRGQTRRRLIPEKAGSGFLFRFRLLFFLFGFSGRGFLLFKRRKGGRGADIFWGSYDDLVAWYSL